MGGAHLGEGGHGHAVGPLLEGVAALCWEGLGGHAIVRRWDGDVVLVQEVASAAALPLLQAGGPRAEVSAPCGDPRATRKLLAKATQKQQPPPCAVTPNKNS